MLAVSDVFKITFSATTNWVAAIIKLLVTMVTIQSNLLFQIIINFLSIFAFFTINFRNTQRIKSTAKIQPELF